MNVSTTFESLRKNFLWGVKGFSGLAFSWVLTIMGKEFINFGLFSFIFLLLSLTMAFIYLVKDYKYTGVLCVDAILISLFFGFGFYVNLAYNP